MLTYRERTTDERVCAIEFEEPITIHRDWGGDIEVQEGSWMVKQPDFAPYYMTNTEFRRSYKEEE